MLKGKVLDDFHQSIKMYLIRNYFRRWTDLCVCVCVCDYSVFYCGFPI